MPVRTSSVPRPKYAVRHLTLGGLLVVCGPPLGGKGPLAARVEEMLPNAVKFESVDNLANEGQFYQPRTARGKAGEHAEDSILRDAARAWQAAGAVAPLILVCARFESAALRMDAAEFAAARGMRFLLVEAKSTPIRSLRRISRLMLTARETSQRIARYETARRAYEPTTPVERAKLPAISFKTVLADLEKTADRVVVAWNAVG